MNQSEFNDAKTIKALTKENKELKAELEQLQTDYDELYSLSTNLASDLEAMRKALYKQAG